MRHPAALLTLFVLTTSAAAQGDKPVLGLIPRAAGPVHVDGKLDEWQGAFVAPVHVGHPDFANRGAQFLFLWDEQNLYVGMRCLDQHPADNGNDRQLWNGDAVEFYIDTRRGADFAARDYTPGSLHMYWTPFTKTEIKPRTSVRELPVFKDFKLKGVEVAAERTPWGWTCEMKLPWANFPDFHPKAGEVIGLDCELCSSDGGPRVDRTFTYSSPAAVGSPSAFGRVRLVEKLEPADLEHVGQALLPLSLTKSFNYAALYATAGISPTIAASVAKVEGRVVDAQGKTHKTAPGRLQPVKGTDFVLWTASLELFDLPPAVYTFELQALGKDGKILTSRKEPLLVGHAAPRP